MRRRRVNVMLIALIMCLITSFPAFAEGMYVTRSDDSPGAFFGYSYDDNTFATNEWKQVNENWFYFDGEGISKRNTWAEIDGKWYYFDHWSVMMHDTTTPDGYQVGSDGAWITDTNSTIDTSIWIGTYKATDGQIITVKSADSNGINVTFNGYSEEGEYTQEYTLLFEDDTKMRAVYNDPKIDQKDIYTLTGIEIEVAVEPAGGWKQGMYVKQ